MRRLRFPALTLAALLLLAGCDHSPSMSVAPDRPEGPFAPGPAALLTYNSFDDTWPSASSPGLFSYQFQRGTPDRDICAGVMSSRGGGRVAEVCAWEPEDLHRSDRFSGAVLLDDQRMAWVRHTSGIGNQAAQSGGLYLGSTATPRDAKLVLPLLIRPPQAAARWDLLIDPVKSGPNEITALAAQWIIGPTRQFGPIDTLYIGIELAKIDLSTTPVTVTPFAQARNAIAWTREATTGDYYFLRPTYAPATDFSNHQIIADSVFRVEGGEGTPVWGQEVDPTSAGKVEGLTSSGGQLLISEWKAEMVTIPTQQTPVEMTTRRLLRLVAPFSTVTVLQETSRERIHFGRIAGEPISSAVVTELISGNQIDLYRLEVQP